jgi:DNA processing protein
VRDDPPPAADEIASVEATGVRLVSFEDAEYPGNLREIPDPPPVLFVRGRIEPEDERAIAVIGSRKASAYGVSVCGRLVRALVDHGFSIVSGMAKGVDAAAHWAALNCDGRTLAVLGTGVDVVIRRQTSRCSREFSIGVRSFRNSFQGPSLLPRTFPVGTAS